MKTILSSNQIPAWHLERAAILHRACKRMQAALDRGGTLKTICRRVSRNYHQRPLKSDPARRLHLTTSTLRHLFAAWKANGELPVAFRLRYRPAPPRVPAPLLVRFVEFCAVTRHGSMKEAWQKFCASRRVSRLPVKISLGQVYYYFPATAFYQMQAQQRMIQKAQFTLAALRLGTIADIRAHVPDCVPRPRRENDFQI